MRTGKDMKIIIGCKYNTQQNQCGYCEKDHKMDGWELAFCLKLSLQYFTNMAVSSLILAF